jgi:ribosomal protein L11 methyltransferase
MQADISWSHVAEQDWVRLTQSQFDPIEITPKLWIVPSWHAPKSDANIINLRLDPGLAFGTGSHPTTCLCLEWLEQASLHHKRVLDYGCGSGILAIAALKLGAAHAVAIDIDPQAVQSAQANAIANQVMLTTGLPNASSRHGTFAIVVANILSNPLKVLAPTLTEHVEPGGYLVLSGVLERQAQEVIAAYGAHMPMLVWKAKEGWVCLVGQRPA